MQHQLEYMCSRLAVFFNLFVNFANRPVGFELTTRKNYFFVFVPAIQHFF